VEIDESDIWRVSRWDILALSVSVIAAMSLGGTLCRFAIQNVSLAMGAPGRSPERSQAVPFVAEEVPCRLHKVTYLNAKWYYSNLSWLNKKILKSKGSPEGDFRDWNAIRAWAREPLYARFVQEGPKK
jgi:hypothetical protein